MPRVRIGVRIPQYGSTWIAIRDAAEHVEALGFDGIWANDHLQSPGRLKSEPTFDALTTLAALAPLTTRVRLGIAVLAAGYRPAALAAKMTSVLDTIAGGRLIVGLGTGSDRAEHAAYDVPFGEPAQRTRALVNAFGTIRDMQLHPDGPRPNRPAAAPPIWIAAHKPQLLRFAGEHADGIVAAWVGPDDLAARIAIAEEARLTAGRPPIARCLYTFVLAYRSEREALDWLAAEAAALATTPIAVLRWLRTTGIVGTVEEVRDALGAAQQAGATDAVIALPSRTPLEVIDALRETVPQVGSARDDGADTGRGPADARAGSLPTTGRERIRANLVDLLVERHRRAGRGSDPAVIDSGGAWTFDDLDVASARAAGRLRAAGVGSGDRVAVVLDDGREWCAAFLGAARLGAVAVPLEPGERHTEAILDDIEPRAVVVAAAQDVGARRTVVTTQELAEGPELPICGVHPEDLAYMIFSSGSTGRPKGAMHAHRDLAASVEGYARSILDLGAGDRCHSVARLFASLGFGNGFFRPLGRGSAAVFSAVRPTVRSVLNTVATHDVTVLSAVPTFWAQLATFLERHPDPAAMGTVRLAVSSGDALPASVADRIRTITGVPLVEGLGCSECSNIVLSTRPDEPLPGTLGRVVPGVEVRLADADGLPVAPGTPGRLWIKSPSNTSGYWRRSAETRDLLFGPWIRMGDVLREDDGVYRHLGRADDMFKVDAKFVSPVEVEGVLHEHAAVAEAAVVGRPDDAGLMRVAAFVVRKDSAGDDDALSAELRALVARRLAPFMAPAAVHVVAALPRGATGKVDRKALRES